MAVGAREVELHAAHLEDVTHHLGLLVSDPVNFVVQVKHLGLIMRIEDPMEMTQHEIRRWLVYRFPFFHSSFCYLDPLDHLCLQINHVIDRIIVKILWVDLRRNIFLPVDTPQLINESDNFLK